MLFSLSTLVGQEHSKIPWLHCLEGLRTLTNDSLGGKHLSPYSLYSAPSYGTVAQGLPHTRITDNTETHSSGTSTAAWNTPKYSWWRHSDVVAAAIAECNERRCRGFSDVGVALKCVDRLSQLCVRQHADELQGLMIHCHSCVVGMKIRIRCRALEWAGICYTWLKSPSHPPSPRLKAAEWIKHRTQQAE